MEVQYRCKCGKVMLNANERCSDCGSLGPHSFIGKNVPVAGSTDISETIRRRGNQDAEYTDRREVAESPGESLAATEDHVPAKPSYPGSRAFEENDSNFPVGMHSHSPMLDHIRSLEGEQRETKEHPEKSGQHIEAGDRYPSYPYDTDGERVREKERLQPPSKSSIVSTIITVVLVVALLIAVIYVINNFEEITQWLASPTVPESVQFPSE